jgi:hypothetical protein
MHFFKLRHYQTMKRLATYVMAAAVLATPLMVQAEGAPAPLRAVAQIKDLRPLSGQALAQIRAQGWVEVVSAVLVSCSGSCSGEYTSNVQHVSQYNSSATGSNVSVIRQVQ